MSRLGLGLGLTKGGVIPFNPLSLDPYLLFDTQSSMIGTFENPTLDLDPSDPDTLDVITATRAGVATYTDADGLIQSAAPNTTRVDYTQGAELTPTKFQRVGYTDFSSGWSNTNTTAVAGDGFEGEPSMLVTSTAGVGRYQITIPNTVEGREYRLSFSIKELINSGDVRFRTGSAGGGSSANFETPITSEWTRVEATILGRVGGGNVTFGVEIVTSGGSVEISQPQFEEGTTATTFVENTTGSPKFITGATFGPRVPMILVEPSATNLIAYSDFSAGVTLSNGATLEQTTESTPLPSQTALRLTSTQVSSRYQTPSAYASGTSTASVYIKWDGVDTRFRIERGVSSSRADFNVTQGGVTHYSNTADGYSIEEHGDGWWRVSNTMANPTWVQLYADVDDGDGSILIALPQHEAGSIPTSFIPTSGGDAAARTRAKDKLEITGSDFGFYNQSEGTFYLETDIRKIGTKFYFDVSDGGSGERVLLYDNNTDLDMFTRSGGTTVDRTIGSTSIEGLQRIAFSYSSSNMIGSLNGNAEVNEPSSSVPSSVNKITLGSRYNQGGNLNGHIKRLIYWPYHSDSL